MPDPKGVEVMANTPHQEAAMNSKADEFMQELRTLLVNSNQEQRNAIGQFVDLIQKHYMTAGYKRILDRTRRMRPVMK